MSQVDEALANYRRALDLHRHRAEQSPSDIKIQQNKSGLAMRVGKALAKLGRYDEAREHLTESLTVAENLSSQAADNVRMQVVLIEVLSAFGDRSITSR